MWTICKKQIPSTRKAIAPLIKRESARTVVDVQTFIEKCEASIKAVKQMRFWTFATGYQQSLALIDETSEAQEPLRQQYKKLLHVTKMFEVADTMAPAEALLNKHKDTLQYVRVTWDVTKECLTYFDSCHDALWATIDANVMEEKAKLLLKKIRGSTDR